MMNRKAKLEAMAAKNHVPGNGTVTTVAKDSKKVKLRAVVYPQGGGQPYEEDVQVDDQGTFTLKDSSLTYHVSKGSVIRGMDGLMRTNVREGDAQTVNMASLDGDNVMHPMVLNAIVENNLWKQWNDWMGRQGLWKQAGTWGMIAIGICLVGVLIWNIKTTGNGFEELKDALQTWNGGQGGAPSGSSAGHNSIAPGA